MFVLLSSCNYYEGKYLATLGFGGMRQQKIFLSDQHFIFDVNKNVDIAIKLLF